MTRKLEGKTLEQMNNAPRVRISVLQEDIDLGIAGNSNKCAIVRAIERAFPNAKYISVDAASIRFTLDGLRYVWFTPRQFQEIVLMNDTPELRKYIKPTSCELRIGQVTTSATKRNRKKTRTPKAKRTAHKYPRARMSKSKEGRGELVPHIIGGKPLARGLGHKMRTAGLRGQNIGALSPALLKKLLLESAARP